MKSVYIPLVRFVEPAEPVSLDDYGIVEEPESDIALAIDMRRQKMGTDPDELRPMLNMSGEPEQHEREGTIASLSSNEVLCVRTQLYVPVNTECLCGETHERVLSAPARVRAQNADSNNNINITNYGGTSMSTVKTVYKVAKVGKYGDCAVTFQLENGVSEYTFINAKVVDDLGITENSILDIEHVISTGSLERTWDDDGIAKERKNPQRRLKIAGTVSVVGQAVGVVAGTTVNK